MINNEFWGCDLEVIISESLAANLEKVRQTSVWQIFQSSDLFDFDLFALLTRVSLWGTIKKDILIWQIMNVCKRMFFYKKNTLWNINVQQTNGKNMANLKCT